jgi:serine/threonine protein kinase
MATLFMGRQSGAAGFSRIVAIKAVHPELSSDDQFRQMLVDEALLASHIHHPHVVHVESLGEHQGAPFLVMEYVHGCSLSQLQRALVACGRRLAPALATRIAITAADALHAAHEACDERGRPLHAVHRDVSPENILLSYAGHVKLIDFGIAKAYGRRHKTREGLIKGKFRYMAPEQAYAQAIDRRTDIYQLGVVLWELLTLRRLFDADDESTLLAQVRAPQIVAPGVVVAGIPALLDAAVMAALDPEPRARPADAQQFGRMLARALPAVQEVDSAALSAMALGLMREQRANERSTLPPLVYEVLERQVVTAPHFGKGSGPDSARFTVEQPRESVVAIRESVSTAPEHEPGSPAKISRGMRSEPPRMPRVRRLVRVASELTTKLTALAHAATWRKLVWLCGGAVLGLALTSAVALLMLRGSLRRQQPRPAPPVPDLVASRVTDDSAALSRDVPRRSSSLDLTRDAGSGARLSNSARLPERSESAEHQHRQSAERDARPERGKLPNPRNIDGTPLITEPGF